MNILGPILAIGLGVAELVALWRWGLLGCLDRIRWLTLRLAHGPAPKVVRRVDYAEIARLECEVFGSSGEEWRI